MRFKDWVYTLLVVLSVVCTGAALARESKQKRKENALKVRQIIHLSAQIFHDTQAGAARGETQALLDKLKSNFAEIAPKLKGVSAGNLKAAINTYEQAIVSKDVDKIRAAKNTFEDYVVKIFVIETAPAQTPDPLLGAGVYKARCVMCHGERGEPSSALALSLNPRPPRIDAGSRMSVLTPFVLYNRLITGTEGSSMASFDGQLTDHELWSVAFWTLTLSVEVEPADLGAIAQLKIRRDRTLQDLARTSNLDLIDAFKAQSLCADAASCSDKIAWVRKALSFDPSLSRK